MNSSRTMCIQSESLSKFTRRCSSSSTTAVLRSYCEMSTDSAPSSRSDASEFASVRSRSNNCRPVPRLLHLIYQDVVRCIPVKRTVDFFHSSFSFGVNPRSRSSSCCSRRRLASLTNFVLQAEMIGVRLGDSSVAFHSPAKDAGVTGVPRVRASSAWLRMKRG